MWRSIISVLLLVVLTAPTIEGARAAGTAEPSANAADVYTRGVVRSISEEDGNRLYIRLKLVPRAKLPFTTVTYRVMDPSLVAGLREGQSIAFRAERRDGQNVLTAIRLAQPCQRFQTCE